MEPIKNTTELLGLTDKNIKILFAYKEKTHQVLRAKLDYDTPACPHCQGDMIKFDFQRESKIPLLEVQGLPTVLALKKRRFQCKSCRKVVVSETPIVQKNHQISVQIFQKIADLLIEKQSMTDIARRLSISTSTVLRKLQEFSFKPSFTSLPKVMSWDEFSFKKGEMCFIAQDYETSAIITVLNGRTETVIRNYFQNYDLKVRQKVKFITMDMYSPYFGLVKRLFPNAQIILDRFHIMQHLARGMNRLRIQIMNDFKNTKSIEYRGLKKHWRLIQKNSYNLSEKTFYDRTFRMWTNSRQVRDKLISFSDKLKYHYNIYQLLLSHFEERRADLFYDLIETEIRQVDEIFSKVFETFIRNKKFILNSFDYPYSNARLEATNNLIKVIKRNAFGFRNFENFKKRIYVNQNIKRESTYTVLSRVQLSSSIAIE